MCGCDGPIRVGKEGLNRLSDLHDVQVRGNTPLAEQALEFFRVG